MGSNLSFGIVVGLNEYGGGGVVGDCDLNENDGETNLSFVVGGKPNVSGVDLNEYGGGDCDLNENDGETNLSFDVVGGGIWYLFNSSHNLSSQYFL